MKRRGAIGKVFALSSSTVLLVIFLLFTGASVFLPSSKSGRAIHLQGSDPDDVATTQPTTAQAPALLPGSKAGIFIQPASQPSTQSSR